MAHALRINVCKARLFLATKKALTKWVMFLAENLKALLSASIAFVRTNTEWAKPKPLYKQKERTKRFITDVLSFSVSEVFAAAKVKLLCSEVCATHK